MKKPKAKVPTLSRSVARRIMARCARGEKRIVVVARNGTPTSVYGLEEYLKIQEQPRKVKPWTARKARRRPTDDLPCINAGIIGPLDREHYYEQ